MEASELCQACGAFNSSVGTVIQAARGRVDLCPQCLTGISPHSLPASRLLRSDPESAGVRALCASCSEPCKVRRIALYVNRLSPEPSAAYFICEVCFMLLQVEGLRQSTVNRIEGRLDALVKWDKRTPRVTPPRFD